MRIFFIPKQWFQLLFVLLVCFMAIGIVWMFFDYTEKESPTEPTMLEPIYCGSTKESRVALAINVDWGEEVLPNLLEILKKQNVRATFFVTGRFAERFPELVIQIAEAGHEIGNHGYAHAHPDRLSVSQNEADIQKAEGCLSSLVDDIAKLYAPPYGECGSNCVQAAEQCGYTTVLWTADTIDWEEPAPSQEEMIQRVTGEKLQKGAIILMHPKPHTADALDELILTLKEKGYVCGTVSEVL